MYYKPTIGLEIHIELATESKMFCDCLNDSSRKDPNKNICPVCMAHPGVLPVINKEAVKMVIKTALALRCEINQNSFFERKNYFYPDLPKGYQISQYQAPLSYDGYLDIKLIDYKGDDINPEAPARIASQSDAGGRNPKSEIINSTADGSGGNNNPNSAVKTKRIRIERIHLEEDTGSLCHPEGSEYSLVDFNRSGVPLMELVTQPDIESAQEARDFVKELQLILDYLAVSGVNMEKGEMRVEVNISLRPENQVELGTKVEIKNLNSLKSMEKSIEFEIKRQSEILERGDKIIQETRGWHDVKQITFSQRNKEEAHDYRYFPEPDLPPLKIGKDLVKEIKSEIPELPSEKRQRFAKEYKLSENELEMYVSQRDLGGYFEKVVSELRNWVAEKYQAGISEPEFHKLVKLASNYISTDLQAMLKEKDVAFREKMFSITPENFAEFLSMIYLGEISSKIAKMVLQEMFVFGGDPSQIIFDKGWQMVSDASEIEKAVKEVITDNPGAVEDFKNGKQNSLQFLIGHVMAKTKGKAKPEMVKEVFNKMLF